MISPKDYPVESTSRTDGAGGEVSTAGHGGSTGGRSSMAGGASGRSAIGSAGQPAGAAGQEETSGGAAGSDSGGTGGGAGAAGSDTEPSAPSCANLPSNCGRLGEVSCCSANLVTGGSFERDNDIGGSYAATVSSFRLDTYEITVGRFRQFVEAYPDSIPQAGTGANPNNTQDLGWDSSWLSHLPVDQAALIAIVKCDAAYQNWTDTPSDHERRPMNCIDWYESYAFCIWDGGRLPTEAEWNYAAAGGGDASGQRHYPWSIPAASEAIDSNHAVYSTTLTADVGSRSPQGDGRFGQADLAGNVWEWVLDWYAPYPTVCNDCANTSAGAGRIIRGGGFSDGPAQLLSSQRTGADPTNRNTGNIGARCARSVR